MKMGYIALLLIILICVLLVLFNIYLAKTVETMSKTIDSINNLIENKDYSLSADYYKKLKNQWKKSEKIIEFLVECEEIDNVNGVFAEIDSYFEREFFEDFFEASYRLNFYINHLYEKNQVNIETVF